MHTLKSPTPGAVPTAESLRQRGLELGLAAVGVTSASVLEPARSTITSRKAEGLNGEMQFTYRNPTRSTDPRQRMPSAQSLVVAALGYGSVATTPKPPEPESATAPQLAGAGRVARYVWADDYRRLEQLLDRLAEPLRLAGFRAQVLLDSNHLVDRNVAWRAGLGWYGKNSNLLLPGAGSWYVLGSILTDAWLEPAAAAVDDGCGPCTRCIDDCPTQAIVAPGVVDARRCIAWLVQAAEPIPVEFRAAVGDRIYGCDDCQEVCPPNRQPAAGVETTELRADIGWILSADDDAIMARHGRWYIANRDVDVIRRTALVVLGNTAEPSWGPHAIVDLLGSYLASDRPLLRNHAVWATRRLGLTDVGTTESFGIDLPICCVGTNPTPCSDPDLHHELMAPVEGRFTFEQWTGAAAKR